MATTSVCYTATGPDGTPYDEANIIVSKDATIGTFGAMVARAFATNSVPNSGATVYTSGSGNQKACSVTNILSIYAGEGTKEAPFHINLKPPRPANGKKSFRFGPFVYC